MCVDEILQRGVAVSVFFEIVRNTKPMIFISHQMCQLFEYRGAFLISDGIENREKISSAFDRDLDRVSCDPAILVIRILFVFSEKPVPGVFELG